MFDRITVRGTTATILWGYRTAAVLRSWTIARNGKTWTLTGVPERVDAFQCRQKPLLFTAPRDKGRWCWMVEELHINERMVKATLGPPLQ